MVNEPTYQYPTEGWRCECGDFAHYERLDEVMFHGFLNCLIDGAAMPTTGITGERISADG